MPMVFDPLTGKDVDSASEEWRHSCECRHILRAYPTRQQKHLHLYGVPDRAMLFERDQAGEMVMKADYKKLWPKNDRGRTVNPLMHWRGIDEADRILADARKLYEQTK